MAFFIFFQVLIFGVVSLVKGQKIAQNDKALSIALHISGNTSYDVICGKQVQNDIISRPFLFIQNFDFSDC